MFDTTTERYRTSRTPPRPLTRIEGGDARKVVNLCTVATGGPLCFRFPAEAAWGVHKEAHTLRTATSTRAEAERAGVRAGVYINLPPPRISERAMRSCGNHVLRSWDETNCYDFIDQVSTSDLHPETLSALLPTKGTTPSRIPPNQPVCSGATRGRRQRRNSSTTGDEHPKPRCSTRSSTTPGTTSSSSGNPGSSTSMGACGMRR